MRTTIRLWMIKKTDKAYFWSKVPQSKNPDFDGIWIPKSMIECIVWLQEEAGEWRGALVDVQEWFAEKKGLL